MSAQHTPGPWFVRKRERNGELQDCFVAAPDMQGLPYDAEILGDDEYHDGVQRKLADCELIVECVNGYAALKAQRDELLEALSFYAEAIRYHGPNQRKEAGDKWTPADAVYQQDVCRDNGAIARAAIAKATGSVA